MNGSSAFRIGGLLALAVTAIAVVAFLPIERYLTALLEWVRGVGLWGAVVVGAASVLFVPGAILTLGAEASSLPENEAAPDQEKAHA